MIGIQIITDTNQTALASTTANGFRIADIPYTGSPLASSTLYYWRIKFWDQGGLDSAYSTSSAFTLAPTLGTAQYVDVVQNTTFTYDAVGNITGLTDYADTGVGKTIAYTYDTLYRLTTASTTQASSTPYALSYTYDILGNISTFENTAYTYNTPGYANPHAATIIGGIPQYYDQNGSLASTTRTTLSWDYRNRLLSYGTGLSTTTFGYDHGPDRVFKATGTATTTYVSKLYNTDNSHTKHVFTSQGDLIATIIGTTASTTATTTYAHTDHLGGTSATTNTDGDVTELSDFYPYGAPRVSLNYTGTPEQRKYAGTERDTETNLDYALNRYLSNREGGFVTQDSVFYEVGITKDGKSVLMDPQSANSYSYARDNPIQNKDTLGRFFEFFASAAVPGRSWSIGLRADSNGFGYFLSGGVGVGVHGGLGLMWAPGQDLSQERSTGIVASVTGAEGLGGRLWQNLSTYSPEQRENVANGGPGFGVVLGAGYSATLELEGYSPLWVWRKQSKPSQLGSTAGIPSTIGAYRGASGSISPRNTSGGAGSSINVPGGSLWIVNGNLYDFGDHKSTPPILLGPAQVKNK